MEVNTDYRSSIGPLRILVTWQPTTRIHTSKNVIHADGIFLLWRRSKESLLLDVLCCQPIILQLLISSLNQISVVVRFR